MSYKRKILKSIFQQHYLSVSMSSCLQKFLWECNSNSPSSGSWLILPSFGATSSTVKSENEVLVEKLIGVPSIASNTLTWSLQVVCSSKPRSWLWSDIVDASILFGVDTDMLFEFEEWIFDDESDEPWRIGGVGGFFNFCCRSLSTVFEFLKIN